MSHRESQDPKLAYDSYIAIALQPRAYGCRNKEEVKRNLKNQSNLIDDVFANAYLAGGGPVKLIALADGYLQGFYDE